MSAGLYIGLMSGTSADGVDAVLLDVSAARLHTLAMASVPFPQALRQAIHDLREPGSDELARAAGVANRIAELYAEAVQQLLTQSGHHPGEVIALGAHGQTVRHRPEQGYTLQLLNAALLAERTGIAVVHDLRSADVAAGGQGAPLVPAFHANVFASHDLSRAIVNIGGIANVSLIAPSGAPAVAHPEIQAQPPVLGHDTGPGNTLLDAWNARHQGTPHDEAGAWAAGGKVHPRLLETLLSDPYFSLRPPKSTGQDHFNATWLERALASLPNPDNIEPRDVQATLAELTALTIAQACQGRVDEVFLCGGGVFNADLIRRIERLLPGLKVDTTSALGIEPMTVEAAAFAWLAYRRVAGLAGNLPAVTGAAGERVLGAITDPGGRLRAR